MTDKTKIYAWDGTNWVEVLVDATGRLIVVAEIDHLNDIGDVNVPAPDDDDILYWDEVAGEWKDVAHLGVAAAHHAKYTNANAVTAMGVKGDANALHHDKYTDAKAVLAVKADAGLPVVSITFIIDGGGVAITTGVKGYLEIPFACTINRVTSLADVSGSIVVDIWKDTYANFPPLDGDSITAAAPPTISGATKDQDATLTGWTTAITAGDILAFNVDSCATITRVTISLKVTKT